MPRYPKAFNHTLEKIRKNAAGDQVSFYNAGLTDEDCLHLYEALKTNTTLESITINGKLPLVEFRDGKTASLDFSRKGYGNQEAIIIATLLRKNTSVTSIYLEGNKIGDAGAAAIAKMLEVNKSLASLNLAENLQLTDKGWAEIAKGLAKNNSVKVLDLGGNRIGDKGAAAIADMLRVNKSLTSLNLSGNYQITDKGWAEIAKGLADNNTLESLNLWKNNIGNVGAAALANALEKNTSVKELNLAFNEIGDAGATAIAKVLEVNTGLTSLDMSQNQQITDKGWIEFAEGLELNTGLTSLNMSCNQQITDKGWAEFAKGLAKNTSVQKLDLYGNNIGNAGATAIAKVLEKNTSVTTVNLGGNEHGDKGITAIAGMLMENSTLTRFILSLPDGSEGAVGLRALLNMKIERKRNHRSELDIRLDYAPQSFNEQKMFNSLVSSSSSNGSSCGRCKFISMCLGFLFVAPLSLPVWLASVSRLMFAGGKRFRSVFADVVGYFNKNSRNEALAEEVFFHACSGICCCSVLLWAPLVAIFVTISNEREHYEATEDQADNLQVVANLSLVGILLIACAITAKLLHLYCKDSTAKTFDLLPNKSGRLSIISVCPPKRLKESAANWINILSFFTIFLQMQNFAAPSAVYPEGLGLEKVYSLFMLNLPVVFGLEASIPAEDLSRVRFWLFIGIQYVWFSLGSLLICLVTFKQDTLAQISKHVDIPAVLFGKAAFLPVMSELLKWLDCDYEGDPSTLKKPVTLPYVCTKSNINASLVFEVSVGVAGSNNSSDAFIFSDDCVEHMQCWSQEHRLYAALAMISMIMYVVTTGLIVPSYAEKMSGDAEIMQTGLALFLDNLMKLTIILVQVFIPNSRRWFHFAVIAVIQMMRFALLVSKSPRAAFFKNSFPLFSEVEALSAAIICWSALCSILAPEENRELNYTPFGLMVGGSCIAVILFAVVRQKPLCICLGSCCVRQSKSWRARTVSKAKRAKHALGSVPLDALALKDDTSVHISSLSESDSEDENEGNIHSESEENFEEEKKTDS